MADAAKEVMLNLKIEAAHIPGRQGVMRGKVGGCFHFMYGPGLRHESSTPVRGRKVTGLHGMRQLKNDGERQAGKQMRPDKRHEHMGPGVETEWQQKCVAIIEQLGETKETALYRAQSAQAVRSNATGKEFFDVPHCDPG